MVWTARTVQASCVSWQRAEGGDAAGGDPVRNRPRRPGPIADRTPAGFKKLEFRGSLTVMDPRLRGNDGYGGNDGRRESDVSRLNDVIPAQAGIQRLS